MISRDQIRKAGIAAGTDKVKHHAYDRFYAKFLCEFNGEGSILEIGYGNGESIAFWRSLYPSSFLYVVDRDVELKGDCFRVLKCDQSSADQLYQLREFLKDKDVGIIVDDGSHIPEHQLITFNILFPILNSGGVYVIEDIECSYWRYGDCYGYKTSYGINSADSLINKLMLLPHWVNREFLAESVKTRLKQFLQRKGFSLSAVEKVADVSFAHNCASITKCLDSDIEYASRDYRMPENIMTQSEKFFIDVRETYFWRVASRLYNKIVLIMRSIFS